VHRNGLLKLDPGRVQVRRPDRNRGTGVLLISGTLEALGTAESKVAFTSFWDDEIGGDTDGTAALPAPGDWQGIVATDEAHVNLDHVSIRYGGKAGANLRMVDVNLSLKNSEIWRSAAKGLAVTFTGGGQPLLVRDNAFVGNRGYAASLSSAAPALVGLDLSGNNGSATV